MRRAAAAIYMAFLYRPAPSTLDSICLQTDLFHASHIATEVNGDQVMFPQAVAQNGYAYFEKWVSAKAIRLALVLGSLVLMSIAINALIILAGNSRL